MQAMCQTDDTNPLAISPRIMDPIWRRRQFEIVMMVSHGMHTMYCISQSLSENLIASKHKTVTDEKWNRARFFPEKRIPFCNANQTTKRITSGKWPWSWSWSRSSAAASLKTLINGLSRRWKGGDSFLACESLFNQRTIPDRCDSLEDI
jgi:hypothetical protein